MAPPACESASQAVEESDARGSKKGARKGQLENCPEGSWDRLGVLLAPLRPVSGRLSPPGGAPERLREVIFGGILGPFLEVFLAPRPRR